MRIKRCLVGCILLLVATIAAAERLGPQVYENSYRVTERNETWARFAWKARVSNPDDVAYSFTVVAEFTDRDGYTVDSDRDSVDLRPFEEREVTGDTLIRLPAADNVSALRVRIRR